MEPAWPPLGSQDGRENHPNALPKGIKTGAPIPTPMYDRKPIENDPKTGPKSIPKRIEFERYVAKAEVSFRANVPSLLLDF